MSCGWLLKTISDLKSCRAQWPGASRYACEGSEVKKLAGNLAGNLAGKKSSQSHLIVVLRYEEDKMNYI
jgi:hypothetical protein